MIPTDDAGWWLSLFEPQLRGTRRRLSQLGMPSGQHDRALKLVAGRLADEGPLTRSQIAERLETAGIGSTR